MTTGVAGSAATGKLSVSGPVDDPVSLGQLTFTLSMEQSSLTSGKSALILSAIRDKQSSGKEFYSQTNTLGSPIAHPKGDNETYYRIYTVTVSTNYSDLAALDTQRELDDLLAQSQQAYRLTFANTSVTPGTGEVAQNPKFALLSVAAPTAIDSDDEVADEFAGSHVETITVDEATVSGIEIAINTIDVDNHGSWTYYLVAFMDGTDNGGTHAANTSYVGGVQGAHAIV